jgi:basic membrane protein A
VNVKKILTSVVLSMGVLLAGCQNTDTNSEATSAEDSANSEFRVAMVTDSNGIDDRSFNQSAWEGLQDWAESHDFSENSIQYFQSGDQSNYIPHLNTAVQDNYDIVYAIGFSLEEAVAQVASQNPDQKFGMLDGLVDEPNVVSITFADNEASYLAGVAAAMTTQTNKIGFVGGQLTPNIEKFQAGYEAGAKAVNPEIEIDAQYIESFSDAGLAQQAASAMYSAGVDVVFHAAGNAGNGVNTEARNRLEAGAEENLWVIGVDRDQSAEGEWAGGNFVLTSTLKELGRAAENEANDVMDDNFHGGEHIVSNLENGGVGIVKTNLPDEIIEAVETAEEQIISGEIEVPEAVSAE